MDYKYQCDDPASVQGRLFHDGEIMNPGIIPYLCGWPPHGSVADSLEVIRKFFSNDHTWALVLKETGEPIGCMGYYPYGESNISIGENDAEPETLRSVFDKLFAEETLTSITDP